MTPTTPAGTHVDDLLEVGVHFADMGHRAVCSCGWTTRKYPLGYRDSARAELIRHRATHGR